MKKLMLTKQPKPVSPPTPAPEPASGPPMNKPVGPPPAPVELPRTFEECVERARMAATGQIEKAHLWAMLAQAHATKQLADKVDALNEYLGVYDEVHPDDSEDGDPPDPRLADTIAEGILGAVSVVKDDVLSNDLVQMAIAAAQRGAVEHLAKVGNGDENAQ